MALIRLSIFQNSIAKFGVLNVLENKPSSNFIRLNMAKKCNFIKTIPIIKNLYERMADQSEFFV